jgi:S-adenosylmethionine:tRNA ribosyltransferase-isomerase
MSSHHASPALAEPTDVNVAEDERLDAFDYPEAWAHIADRPAPVRDASRLLVYDRGTGRVEHRRFRDLPDYCSPGDVVVVNDSRVIPARLEGVKVPSGGRADVLLVRRESNGVWTVLLTGRVRPGQRIAFEAGGEGEVLDPDAAGRTRLRLTPDDTAWLDRAGRVPLPRYIAKSRGIDTPDGDDRARYQTVYARATGSVAAPTAGLHFTDAVFSALAERGVRVATVTLHVGPGTFGAPTSGAGRRTPDGSGMGRSLVRDRRRHQLRPRIRGPGDHGGHHLHRLIESAAAAGWVQPFSGDTSLFIRPGHRWRAVNALVTNFHLPRSTPLVLASPCAGARPSWIYTARPRPRGTGAPATATR